MGAQHTWIMTRGPTEDLLEVVFGKAFLVELDRGNLENATLFARAFLLGKRSVHDRPLVTLPISTRFGARSPRQRPH